MKSMTKTEGRLLIALVAVLIQLTLAGTGVAEWLTGLWPKSTTILSPCQSCKTWPRPSKPSPGLSPRAQMRKKCCNEMLNALIDRKLAKAEAKRRGIVISDKEVDEAMARFKQRNNIPDDETFAKGLSQAGLSLKEFKQQIADQMTQERLLVMVAGWQGQVSATPTCAAFMTRDSRKAEPRCTWSP